MVGILVAITISWLLLYLIEKKSILALGFFPIPRRLKQFSIGFIITGILCVLAQYLDAYLKSAQWILNKNISGSIVLEALFWDVKSVLTEELIFRGALLYLLIQKIGSAKGILISAIAFGIYHWFSYEILGNVIAMILVFIGTGLMGYAWAWAFSKTKSMFLAFGFHLGWNFVHNTIFSKGPLGDLVLISKGGTELSDLTSLLNFVGVSLIVPLLLMIYIRNFVKEEVVVKTLIENEH